MTFSRRTFVPQVAVAPVALGATHRAATVTAPAVSPGVLNAGRDLQSYLSRLFGVRAGISLGDPPRPLTGLSWAKPAIRMSPASPGCRRCRGRGAW